MIQNENTQMAQDSISFEVPDSHNSEGFVRVEVDGNEDAALDAQEQQVQQHYFSDSQVDLISPSIKSELAKDANKESKEMRLSHEAPSFLNMLNRIKAQNLKLYQPHHVALPILHKNNQDSAIVSHKIKAQMHSYEVSIKAYEKALISKGIDLNTFYSEMLIPSEYTKYKKMFEQDAELGMHMKRVSEAGSRLHDTMNSDAFKLTTKKYKDGELGELTSNEFNATMRNLSDKMDSLSEIKLPIIGKNKYTTTTEQAQSIGDEAKGILASITKALSRIFGRG